MCHGNMNRRVFLYSAPLLGIDPAWGPLRDHPGFQTLMEEYAERVE